MFERHAQFKKWYVNTELNDHVEQMKENYCEIIKYKKSIQKNDLYEVKRIGKVIADHGKMLHRQIAGKYIPVSGTCPRRVVSFVYHPTQDKRLHLNTIIWTNKQKLSPVSSFFHMCTTR